MGTAIASYANLLWSLEKFYQDNRDDETVWVWFIAEEYPVSFLDDCENADGRLQKLIDTIDELPSGWQNYDMDEVKAEVLFGAIRYAMTCGVDMEV